LIAAAARAAGAHLINNSIIIDAISNNHMNFFHLSNNQPPAINLVRRDVV